MKHVLISGADGSLGSVVTTLFAQSGWTVHALVFHEKSVAPTLGRGAKQTFVINLTDSDATNALVSSFEKLDAVVHLVGGIKAGKSIDETSSEEFSAMLNLNLITTFNILHATLPLLKKNGGAIVTVGAKSAVHPEKNRAAYTVSKSGVIALTLAAAEEGREFSVRANVIVPSILRTKENLEWAENGEESKWVSLDDVSSLILSLCDSKANAVSGAILPLYGKIQA